MVTTEKHYKAFKWCVDNNIKIYPKPKGDKYILIYSINGNAKSSGKLHEKKNYMEAIWDFYIFLYNKLRNDTD